MLGWWASWPAEKIDGVVVSDRALLDLDARVSPASYLPRFQQDLRAGGCRPGTFRRTTRPSGGDRVMARWRRSIWCGRATTSSSSTSAAPTSSATTSGSTSSRRASTRSIRGRWRSTGTASRVSTRRSTRRSDGSSPPRPGVQCPGALRPRVPRRPSRGRQGPGGHGRRARAARLSRARQGRRSTSRAPASTPMARRISSAPRCSASPSPAASPAARCGRRSARPCAAAWRPTSRRSPTTAASRSSSCATARPKRGEDGGLRGDRPAAAGHPGAARRGEALPAGAAKPRADLRHPYARTPTASFWPWGPTSIPRRT